MKKLIFIVILILIATNIYGLIDSQIQAYNNTHVTVLEADRCQQAVENGMPVEFCD